MNSLVIIVIIVIITFFLQNSSEDCNNDNHEEKNADDRNQPRLPGLLLDLSDMNNTLIDTAVRLVDVLVEPVKKPVLVLQLRVDRGREPLLPLDALVDRVEGLVLAGHLGLLELEDVVVAHGIIVTLFGAE